MEEKSHRSFEEVYESLSKEQRVVCAYLSSSAWHRGQSESFLIALGSMPIIEELVSLGIVYKGDNVRFTQEYLDQNKEKYEAIQADHFNFNLSQEEREFLNQFDRAKIILKEGKTESRYRLYSQQFSDFVENQSDYK